VTTRSERDERRGELAASLAAVRGRIDAACAAAGRDPDEVTLIAITKTFPASDVELLASLGVRDVGENKDQEARAKAEAVRGDAVRGDAVRADEVRGDAGGAAAGRPEPGRAPLRWHFVGQLQRNKVRSVARYADVVHSVDRVRLAGALGAAVADRPEPLDVLLQVDLDPGDEPSGPPSAGSLGPRGGVRPADLAELAAAVAAQDRLRLRGLMAVAPLHGSADEAFARLAELAARFRTDHPAADWLSAGMSGDLETAIGYGATHVRVGRALLGNRVAAEGTVASEATE
jgi:hypothetical protein